MYISVIVMKCEKTKVSLLLIFALLSSPGHTEPTLDFQPDLGTSGFITTDLRHERGQNTATTAPQTRFLVHQPNFRGEMYPEFVPIDGKNYLHLIVGDPADGFAQEVYIEASGTDTFHSNTLGSSAPKAAFGGNHGTSGSGNAGDPLNVSGLVSTGNGTANPQKIIMRQIVSDGEILMEFLKDRFDHKPANVTLLSTPYINSTFVADMRNSDYSDMNSPGIIVNTMSLQGTGTSTLSDFNMANDGDDSFVTAGRYKYTDGGGHLGQDGTYTYLGGQTMGPADFDLIDWSVYWDPLEDNPWSYTGNRPN